MPMLYSMVGKGRPINIVGYTTVLLLKNINEWGWFSARVPDGNGCNVLVTSNCVEFTHAARDSAVARMSAGSMTQ